MARDSGEDGDTAEVGGQPLPAGPRKPEAGIESGQFGKTQQIERPRSVGEEPFDDRAGDSSAAVLFLNRNGGKLDAVRTVRLELTAAEQDMIVVGGHEEVLPVEAEGVDAYPPDQPTNERTIVAPRGA